MKIDRVELHHVAMKLVHPFQTSFGTQTDHHCVLVSAYGEGHVGWGECTVGLGPFYSGETIVSAWTVLKDHLVPMVLGRELSHPSDVAPLTARVRGNEMAKAGLENAAWDLFGRVQSQSVKNMIGGVRDRVPVGVSIGIEPTIEALLARVDLFVDQGYRRIKIKIKRGVDYEPMAAVRDRYPSMMLMADANSDYGLSDIESLKRLDALNLLMIEQPLAHDDIIDHAKLQAQLTTPVCLDESIHHPDDARHAIDLCACRTINVKIGRVGGMSAAIAIHDVAQRAGIPIWCGGMLETGVGRAMNLAMASLPNFSLPGDISATDKYFREDITQPFALNRQDSTMTVPQGPGIGVDVHVDRLHKVRLKHCIAAE